jgi:hypothetical protein
MPTVKEQLQQARDLIQEERYNEARKILRKIDHPTAQKWLDQLDTLEGKRSSSPRPERSRSSSGSGVRRVLFRLILLVIVLGLIGGGYVLYQDGTLSGLFPTPEPTRVALGPDGRPLPTPTPEPSATPVPCEPQVWWDEQEARVIGFINPEAMRTRSDENYQAAVEVLRASRATFAETPRPDCLADLHSRIGAIMDTQLARLDLPQTRMIAFGQTETLEADQIRQYGDMTATLLEQMTSVANTLTALEVDYDDSGTGLSRTIVALVNAEQPPLVNNTATDEAVPTIEPVCPSLRWLYTEQFPASYMIGRGQNVLRNNTADPETTPALIFDLQREAQRLSGQAEPACLTAERQLLGETYQTLATSLQSLLDGDSNALRTNRQAFEDALRAWTEALRALPPSTLITVR